MFGRFRPYRLPKHLTDEDIILESDGEATFVHANHIRRHLAECWLCRSRKQELEQSVTTFADFYRKRFDADIPPIDGPRRVLEARLAAETRASSNWFQPFFSRRVLVACTVSVLALAATTLTLSPYHLFRSQVTTNVHRWRSDLPNSTLSPGVAGAISREAVCRTKSQAGDLVDNALAQKVFVRYRIQRPQPGAYEIDFVIPPALGGLRTVENLWPQPYRAASWNSHAKDALEERLEVLVCLDQIDLKTAQAALTGDWIDAYQRYFRSEQPLLDHAAFSKDRPWPSSSH